MERDQKRLDSSHDEMTFRMQSTEERDRWMRAFPEPLPAGYRLVHSWNDMTLTVRPEAIPTAADEALAEYGRGMTRTVQGIAVEDALRAKLSGMNEADFQTYAVENGVSLPTQTRKASRQQQVAIVLKALRDKAAIPEPVGV